MRRRRPTMIALEKGQRMDFNTAFMALIGNEGRYSLDPRDRGNWTGGAINSGACKGTKYGISAAAYPNLDIENLSVFDAEAIYQRDYWRAAGCDQVPDALNFDLFDMAVNSGVTRAVKALQTACGMASSDIDGVLGARTIAAVRAHEPLSLERRFNGARLHFLTTINDEEWQTQGRGLVNRVANNLMRA